MCWTPFVYRPAVRARINLNPFAESRSSFWKSGLMTVRRFPPSNLIALESPWGIALWVHCHHVPLDNNENRNERLDHASKLFPPIGISCRHILGQMKRTFSLLVPTFQQNANYVGNAHPSHESLQSRRAWIKYRRKCIRQPSSAAAANLERRTE
jgi:hypothetical protein